MRAKWIFLVLLVVTIDPVWSQARNSGKKGDNMSTTQLQQTCTGAARLTSNDFSSSGAYQNYLALCKRMETQNAQQAANNSSTGSQDVPGVPSTSAKSAPSSSSNSFGQRSSRGRTNIIAHQGSLTQGNATSGVLQPNRASTLNSPSRYQGTRPASRSSALEGLNVFNKGKKTKAKVQKADDVSKKSAKTDEEKKENNGKSERGDKEKLHARKSDKNEQALSSFGVELPSADVEGICKSQFADQSKQTFSGKGTEVCCSYILAYTQSNQLTGLSAQQVNEVLSSEEINPVAIVSVMSDPEGITQLRAKTAGNYRFSNDLKNVEANFNLLSSLLTFSAKAFGPEKVREFRDAMVLSWNTPHANDKHDKIRTEIDKEIGKAQKYISTRKLVPDDQMARNETAEQTHASDAYKQDLERLQSMCQSVVTMDTNKDTSTATTPAKAIR